MRHLYSRNFETLHKKQFYNLHEILKLLCLLPNYIRRDTWTSQMQQMLESKTSRDYLMRTSAFFLGSINSWNISRAQRKSAFLIQKHFKKKGILSSFYLSGPRILKNWEYIVKPIYAAYCSVSTAYR